MNYIRQKNFYELEDKLKLQILIKMFTDAGYDLSKWFFNIQISEREANIEELEDACKTAVQIEDFEKASFLRDVIKRKKGNVAE